MTLVDYQTIEKEIDVAILLPNEAWDENAILSEPSLSYHYGIFL
jgi:hypothetical protein